MFKVLVQQPFLIISTSHLFVCLKYAWEITMSPHLQSYRILNRIHKYYQHKFTAIDLIKPLTAIFSLNF